VPCVAAEATAVVAGPGTLRDAIDFSSWPALASTLLGLAVVTLVAIGMRLLVMQTVQQRRERENRQINERLRTLIAAYKTLGGSFTGDLAVDPTHLRDLRAQAARASGSAESGVDAAASVDTPGAERRRRMRDAVEAALSDVILLGTESQVRLAARAASDLAAGRPVEISELVISLRNFIREVLDLDPVPPDVAIPKQGPLRPAASGRGGGKGGGAEDGRKPGAGGRGGGAGDGAGGGAAMLGGGALGAGLDPDDRP